MRHRKQRGKLSRDDGACRAIRQRGRSLLAAGVVGAAGSFKKGDVVALEDSQGVQFARGLSNYSLDEVLNDETEDKTSKETRELTAA